MNSFLRKLQSDPLEKGFSQYRQMSGGPTRIAVECVLMKYSEPVGFTREAHVECGIKFIENYQIFYSKGPYINDVRQNQEICDPRSRCRTSSVETYPSGRRNCRYPAPSCFSPHPHLPFLPTRLHTSDHIPNTEILYTIKSRTYVQIIKLICRGSKFSQIGCAKIEGAPII